MPEGQLEALTGHRRAALVGAGLSALAGGDAGGAQGAGVVQRPAGRRAGADLRGRLPGAVRAGHGLPGGRRRWASAPTRVYDLSNACLGVLNGIVDIANRIELGQVRAGLVVSCETAREINDTMIEDMLRTRSMERVQDVAGHADRRLGRGRRAGHRRLVPPEPAAAAAGRHDQAAPQHHGLCRWGLERAMPQTPRPAVHVHRLGRRAEVRRRSGPAHLEGLPAHASAGRPTRWTRSSAIRSAPATATLILKVLGIAPEKEFSTYEYLGNIGTVSLPLTAALAEEREFLLPGDRVGFLGIGSGLNCLMLGVEW